MSALLDGYRRWTLALLVAEEIKTALKRIGATGRPDSRSGVEKSRRRVRPGACSVKALSWW
jgi:hypothetical protein